MKIVEYDSRWHSKPHIQPMRYFDMPGWLQANCGRDLGARIAWTNGVFDILHTGHLHLFRFCRQQYKYSKVIVGVNSDESAKGLKKSHPTYNTEMDRVLMVASQKDVDFVVIFDEPNPCKCLEFIKPDYFIKGGDYTIEQLPEDEKAVVEAYGGKVLVSGKVEGKSTTGIYKKIYGRGYTAGLDEGLHSIVEGHHNV